MCRAEANAAPRTTAPGNATGTHTCSLEDAASGLVGYILDKQVHLLRLADGANATVGAGTPARFTADGLVLVNGRRIELKPFASLPLR